jgi:predicted metalloprotease with PDZ domain
MMTRKTAALILLGLALAASSAMAGVGKCKYSTQECLDYMSKKYSSRGWVGIMYEPNESSGGITIMEVVPDSPAAAAGLEKGDVLVRLEGHTLPIKDDELREMVHSRFTPGHSVTYTVSRNGEKRDVTVTLGKFPENLIAEAIGRHMLEGHIVVAEN